MLGLWVPGASVGFALQRIPPAMAKKAAQKVPELMVIGAGWGRTARSTSAFMLLVLV